MKLEKILDLKKDILSKMSKIALINLFFQSKNALLLIIEEKTKTIEILSKQVEKLTQEKESKTQQEINNKANQPSSKKPEWDKDGNIKSKKRSQKKRKKRKGSGNQKKNDIFPAETNYHSLCQCPECGKDLRSKAFEKSSRIVEDIIG